MNPALGLLSLLYGAGFRARNTAYDSGMVKAKHLQAPVISVGNLSVGGSGKTPFVILLGQLLKDRGIRFNILSRGYGRATRGVAIVDPNGSSRQFGDEPLLMTRHLQVPVIVGEDRYEAGLAAEQKFGPQWHILDDGFQHRRLARDFDIVLLTAKDLQDHLLPAGRLREPLSSLQRADAVVRMSEMTFQAPPGKEVWDVRRGIRVQHISPRPVAFCGIARPQIFFEQLRAAGIHPAAEASYRDHHAYSERDIEKLIDLRRTSDGSGYVTTEKDEINLGAHRAKLEPLSVIPVQMELVNAPNAVDTLLRVVESRKRPA